MPTLQVEDLETRQLLTGAGSPATPLLPALFVDAARDGRVIELPLRVGHTALVDGILCGWQGMDEVELSRSHLLLGVEGRAAELLYLRWPCTPSLGTMGPQWEVAEILHVGPGYLGLGPGVARDLETIRGNAGGSLALPLGPANGYGGPSSTLAADDHSLRTDRSSPVSPASLPNSLAAVGGRVAPPGLPTVGSSAGEIRGRDLLFALAPNLRDRNSEQRNDSSGIWPVARAEHSWAQPSPQSMDQPAVLQPFDFSGVELGRRHLLERLEGLVLPYGQVSDVLTVLPPLDVSTLELGMRHFLGELEGLSQRLNGGQDVTGVYSWVVAIAAAATACEIARRQLRSAGGSTGDISSLTGIQSFLR